MTAKPVQTSLKRTSQTLLTSMMLTALVLCLLGAFSFWKTRLGEQEWEHYSASQNRDQLLVSQLLEAMGYGGMIHQFKNYVLRGDEPRIDKIRRNAGSAQSLVDQLRITRTTPDEVAALDAIDNVVQSYLDQIGTARSMAALGQTPETIDAKVKVDDGPAVDGIAMLIGMTSGGTMDTKVGVLMQLRNTMGYGGLVHQIKNYVIRQDAPRVDKVSALLELVIEQLNAYRALATRAEELEAIATLDTLVATLQQVMLDAFAQNEAGADARGIDTLVKWDDGPALAALNALELALVQDATEQASQLADSLATSKTTSLILCILLITVLPLLAWTTYQRLHKSAVAPANALSKAMTRLAEGDTSVDASDLVAETEIGRIATASEAFRQAFIKNEEMSRQARLDADAQRKMVQESETLVAKQDKMQTEVLSKASSIQQEVNSIAHSAEDLSRQTEQQAATLENSVAAVDELSNSVVGVAGSARNAQEEMDRVGHVTQTCQSLLDEAVNGMDAIVASSIDVSKVTEVIEQIAFQTNLLALNAGVEAARAGDAGRGFAVVATEVLALAQRSAEAASEIKELINTSTSEIEHGSERITKAGKSFSEIAGMIAVVREIAETVAASTDEQSVGLKALNAAMGDLEQVTQRNVAMFEETAASTRVLQENVQDLLSLSDAASEAEQGEPMAEDRAA